VVGVEAEDAAEAALGFGDQERGGVGLRVGLNVGKERGEVVIEGEDGLIGGIVDAAGTGVGWAEVAGGVVLQAGARGLFRRLTLPRALGALWGDEDPLAEERVIAAVWDEVEGARRGGHRESSWSGEATVTSVSDGTANLGGESARLSRARLVRVGHL